MRASKIRYQGARQEQQDNVTVLDVAVDGATYAIGILTDGIGGLERGAEASMLVNRFVSAALPQLGADGGWADGRFLSSMTELLRKADGALRAYRQAEGIGRCGTTLLIATIGNGVCRFVSVGDSLLYALDVRGKLEKLNAAQVVQVGERLALRSAILGEDMVEIDAGAVDLRASETCGIMLASDGILSLPASVLATELRSNSSAKLRRLAEQIAALRNPTQDNISMILFEIEGDD